MENIYYFKFEKEIILNEKEEMEIWKKKIDKCIY